MKKFKKVQEWLDSNPAKEDLERVMNTINRGVVAEIKKAVRGKESELKKMNKMVNAMKDVGFPVEVSILNHIKETETEISILRKELPEQRK